MFRLAVALILPIAMALAGGSFAWGQGPDVQIVQLQCNDDPEVVIIRNLGDAVQGFAGWELQSDPPGSEAFDLTQLAPLPPGVAVSIQSGPSAIVNLKWGVGEFIFRDDDPTDYARIVDDTGAIVHQVNCAAGATPTASATPEPSPVNGVPNGGGPPPPTGNALLPGMIVLVGGFMASTGLAIIAGPWLRLRRSRPTAPASPQQELVAARPMLEATERRGSGEPSSAAFALALVGGVLASGADTKLFGGESRKQQEERRGRGSRSAGKRSWHNKLNPG